MFLWHKHSVFPLIQVMADSSPGRDSPSPSGKGLGDSGLDSDVTQGDTSVSQQGTGSTSVVTVPYSEYLESQGLVGQSSAATLQASGGQGTQSLEVHEITSGSESEVAPQSITDTETVEIMDVTSPEGQGEGGKTPASTPLRGAESQVSESDFSESELKDLTMSDHDFTEHMEELVPEMVSLLVSIMTRRPGRRRLQDQQSLLTRVATAGSLCTSRDYRIKYLNDQYARVLETVGSQFPHFKLCDWFPAHFDDQVIYGPELMKKPEMGHFPAVPLLVKPGWKPPIPDSDEWKKATTREVELDYSKVEVKISQTVFPVSVADQQEEDRGMDTGDQGTSVQATGTDKTDKGSPSGSKPVLPPGSFLQPLVAKTQEEEHQTRLSLVATEPGPVFRDPQPLRERACVGLHQRHILRSEGMDRFWQATATLIREEAWLRVLQAIQIPEEMPKARGFNKLIVRPLIKKAQDFRAKALVGNKALPGVALVPDAARWEGTLQPLWTGTNAEFLKWARSLLKLCREVNGLSVYFYDANPNEDKHPELCCHCPYLSCPGEEKGKAEKQVYRVEGSLCTHIGQHHIGTIPVRCSYCLWVFAGDGVGFEAYRLHLQLYHPEEDFQDEIGQSAREFWPFSSSFIRGRERTGIQRPEDGEVQLFLRELILRIILNELTRLCPRKLKGYIHHRMKELDGSDSEKLEETQKAKQALLAGDQDLEGAAAGPPFLAGREIPSLDTISEGDWFTITRPKKSRKKGQTPQPEPEAQPASEREKQPSIEEILKSASIGAVKKALRERGYATHAAPKPRDADGRSQPFRGGRTGRGRGRRRERSSDSRGHSSERQSSEEPTPKKSRPGGIPAQGTRRSVLERASGDLELPGEEVVLKVRQQKPKEGFSLIQTESGKEEKVPHCVGEVGTRFLPTVMGGTWVYMPRGATEWQRFPSAYERRSHQSKRKQPSSGAASQGARPKEPQPKPSTPAKEVVVREEVPSPSVPAWATTAPVTVPATTVVNVRQAETLELSPLEYPTLVTSRPAATRVVSSVVTAPTATVTSCGAGSRTPASYLRIPTGMSRERGVLLPQDPPILDPEQLLDQPAAPPAKTVYPLTIKRCRNIARSWDGIADRMEQEAERLPAPLRDAVTQDVAHAGSLALLFDQNRDSHPAVVRTIFPSLLTGVRLEDMENLDETTQTYLDRFCRGYLDAREHPRRERTPSPVPTTRVPRAEAASRPTGQPPGNLPPPRRSQTPQGTVPSQSQDLPLFGQDLGFGVGSPMMSSGLSSLGTGLQGMSLQTPPQQRMPNFGLGSTAGMGTGGFPSPAAASWGSQSQAFQSNLWPGQLGGLPHAGFDDSLALQRQMLLNQQIIQQQQARLLGWNSQPVNPVTTVQAQQIIYQAAAGSAPRGPPPVTQTDQGAPRVQTPPGQAPVQGQGLQGLPPVSRSDGTEPGDMDTID